MYLSYIKGSLFDCVENTYKRYKTKPFKRTSKNTQQNVNN